MKIELTAKQIELLVKEESATLRKAFEVNKQKLEAKFNSEVSKLEKELESELTKLTDKFKFIDFNVKPKKETTARTPFDVDKMKQLLVEKKSVKEIATALNKSEGQVRSKMFNLGIKLSDSK